MDATEIIKQDINFLDKPLWFQDAKNDGLGFVWTDIEGYEYRTGYKLPDKVDILILLYLLMKSQRSEYKYKIELSRYEILKECGFHKCNWKQYYNRLEDSLKRWNNVAIDFRGTFYDGKKYIAIGFGIIDDYEIDEQTKRVKIKFNEKWLLKIKESTFFKYLNFEYYKALKRPLSRRLFEILCKTFKERDTWSIHLTKLGTKLTLSGRKVNAKEGEKEVIYASDVLVAIKPAINEINELSKIQGIAEKLGIHPDDLFIIKYTITGVKQDRIIHFTKIPINQKSIQAPSQDAAPAPTPKQDTTHQADLYAFIPAEHRNKQTVRKLLDKYLNEHGADYAKRNIEYANLYAKKNYRAYLNQALESDWGLGQQEDKQQATKFNVKLQEGMTIEFSDGRQFKIEHGICIHPNGYEGGCMPEGTILTGIKEGQIKVINVR